MKKLLLLIFLAPLFVNGQYPIQQKLPVRETVRIEKHDTLRCLMLVCDTAINSNWGKRVKVNDSLYRLEIRWYEGVYWQFGYEVRATGSGYTENREPYPLIYITAYLDSNKQPLRKSIIVWQSKLR